MTQFHATLCNRLQTASNEWHFSPLTLGTDLLRYFRNSWTFHHKFSKIDNVPKKWARKLVGIGQSNLLCTDLRWGCRQNPNEHVSTWKTLPIDQNNWSTEQVWLWATIRFPTPFWREKNGLSLNLLKKFPDFEKPAETIFVPQVLSSFSWRVWKRKISGKLRSVRLNKTQIRVTAHVTLCYTVL